MESGAVQFQDLFEIMDTRQTTGVPLQDVVQGEYRTSVFTCASDSSGCVFISLSLSLSFSLSLSLFRTGFIPLSGGVCVCVSLSLSLFSGQVSYPSQEGCVCVHPDSKLRVFGVSSR